MNNCALSNEHLSRVARNWMIEFPKWCSQNEFQNENASFLKISRETLIAYLAIKFCTKSYFFFSKMSYFFFNALIWSFLFLTLESFRDAQRATFSTLPFLLLYDASLERFATRKGVFRGVRSRSIGVRRRRAKTLIRVVLRTRPMATIKCPVHFMSSYWHSAE